MPDFDLQIALDRLAESLLPDDEVRQQKANAVVISQDGGVHSRPLVQSLPWYRVDVSIPGAATTGSDIKRVPFPQGGVIRHVSIHAQTPPSSTYQVTLTAGSSSEHFSLQPGIPTTMRGITLPVDPGAWVVIAVTSAGGAANVEITLHYAPLGG